MEKTFWTLKEGGEFYPLAGIWTDNPTGERVCKDVAKKQGMEPVRVKIIEV